jgi:hypothetical protein
MLSENTYSRSSSRASLRADHRDLSRFIEKSEFRKLEKQLAVARRELQHVFQHSSELTETLSKVSAHDQMLVAELAKEVRKGHDFKAALTHFVVAKKIEKHFTRELGQLHADIMR